MEVSFLWHDCDKEDHIVLIHYSEYAKIQFVWKFRGYPINSKWIRDQDWNKEDSEQNINRHDIDDRVINQDVFKKLACVIFLLSCQLHSFLFWTRWVGLHFITKTKTSHNKTAENVYNFKL